MAPLLLDSAVSSSSTYSAAPSMSFQYRRRDPRARARSKTGPDGTASHVSL